MIIKDKDDISFLINQNTIQCVEIDDDTLEVHFIDGSSWDFDFKSEQNALEVFRQIDKEIRETSRIRWEKKMSTKRKSKQNKFNHVEGLRCSNGCTVCTYLDICAWG